MLHKKFYPILQQLTLYKDLLNVRDRALYLQQIRHAGILDHIYETVNRSPSCPCLS
ncbi:MAG: hypothetical protein ACIWVG_15070 [Gloeotrichia echinulata HAB0833]